MTKHSHGDTQHCLHGHAHDAHRESTRAIWWALLLNAGFTVIEFTAGYFSHSVAVLSDAVHDLGDCFTIGFALLLQKYARKGASDRFPFGYARLSAASAVLTSVVLITGSAFMLYEAVLRIYANEHEIRTSIVIPVSIIGLIFNGLAARFLFHGHSHDPGHARKAIALHFIEDILGWAAVLVGSVIIYFTGYTAIDSILSALISLFILFQACRNLARVIPVFFNTRPATVSQQETEQLVKEILGPEIIHSVRIWTIDGSSHVLLISLTLSPAFDPAAFRIQKETLQQKLAPLGIHTVHYDFL